MTRFAIPKSASTLREVLDAKLDLRLEEQILKELRSFRPVTSEKNVWAFWDKGIDAMFPSYFHTVVNWVRKLGSGWTIRVLDIVEGSPNHVYKFLDTEWFPRAFLDRKMDGTHASQHTANLVRLPLLYQFGGMWMDVGNMLHTHLDELFWDRMTAPGSPYELGLWVVTGIVTHRWGCPVNFVIASRKGCMFIKNWHDSYKELWKDHTNCIGFHKHPLVQDVGLADGAALKNLAVGQEHALIEGTDYAAHMLIAERTRNLLDVSTGWNGREAYEKKALLVEGIENSLLAATKTEYSGHKQAELLMTRLDEPDEMKRQAAEDFIVEMLEKSHMFKVFHNPLAGLPTFGDVIKTEGFKDADHRPGTFGEMYRYGTVHWRSEREVEYLIPQPAEDEIIRATVTASRERGRL